MPADDQSITFTAIGHVRCAQRYRYEAARQASVAPDNEAWVQLIDDAALRQGLSGLADFERVWLLYELHLNQSWHALVQPPRQDMGKLGVFATRAPHRPNRIGLSCVRLLNVAGDRLHIGQHDLLDGTPVIDIKPYLPYADAFPEAGAGWVDTYQEQVFSCAITAAAQRQIDWVAEHAGWDLRNFLLVQLRTDPTDGQRKRISATAAGYRIAFRTWRIDYRVDEQGRKTHILAVRSGYTPADLEHSADDRYGDKDAHRAFTALFGNGQ